MERRELIRTIYLYLFSLVGLTLVVIGSVRLVDLGLKTFVFTKADQILIYPAYPRTEAPLPDSQKALSPEDEEKFKQEQLKYEKESRASQRQRETSTSLAFLMVGIPLFWYHWRLIQKSKENNSG